MYHATRSVLKKLDKCQDVFLREISLTPEEALVDHNLAPLTMRRDVAILGLIHRAAIGRGPPQLREMLRRRKGSL